MSCDYRGLMSCQISWAHAVVTITGCIPYDCISELQPRWPSLVKQPLVFLQRFANQNSTLFQPGIAASIVYRNQVIYSKGFGLINKTKPDVPDGNTIFRIGSVSKVFVVSWCSHYPAYIPLYKILTQFLCFHSSHRDTTQYNIDFIMNYTMLMYSDVSMHLDTL